MTTQALAVLASAFLLAACVSPPDPWTPDVRAGDGRSDDGLRQGDGTGDVRAADVAGVDVGDAADTRADAADLTASDIVDTFDTLETKDELQCVPACGEADCGDDGCGGTCGECEGLEECGEGGHCNCPFEKCGGECCPDADEICHENSCCLPDCSGKDCGSNGCGGVCAECPEQYACFDDGENATCDAQCGEICAGLECGAAGLNEECDCGACDDGNVCTEDVCTDDKLCDFPANNEPCYDGNPCTGQDTCEEGQCAGVSLPLDQLEELDCLCAVDADCLEIENGSVCDGTLYCEKVSEEAESGVCTIDPETLPDCDDGHGCTEDTCDPVGGCLFTPQDEKCDDEDVCTDDICSPELGCVQTANELPCTDNSACTDGDLCSGGTCVPGEPVVCTDDFDCTADTCEAGEGCVYIPHDDECDDQKPCTTDVCSVETGCLFTPEDANDCSDGIVCNGMESCSDGDCLSGEELDCDDLSLCTLDSCDPVLGCQYEDVPCDDNSACTTDSCEPAQGCLHDVVSCDDDSACTTDSCEPAQGCLHDTVDCDDGSVCTTDSCEPAEGCQYDTVDCDDDSPCTVDSCNSQTGCAYSNLPNDSQCSGEPQEVCKNGQCVCVPACLEKVCGDDGCGGVCGDCADCHDCSDGQCEKNCGCMCSDKQCGIYEGCNCGSCNGGDVCQDNQCVPPPTTPTWTDPSSGLEWQNPPSVEKKAWAAAKLHCEGLSLDGGSWHLPSISELRSLIRGCPETVTGGACGLTDDCPDDACWSPADCPTCDGGAGPANGCYWPEGMEGECSYHWSSLSYNGGDAAAWFVSFYYGRIGSTNTGLSQTTRCVR